MEFDRFDLMRMVIEAHGRAQYDLGNSNMPDVRLSEIGGLGELSLGEGHPGGSEELRAALARLYGGNPWDYMVTCGASEGNFSALVALVRPGDSALVERPVYQSLEAIPRALGARVVPLVRREEQGFRIFADQVREAIPEGLRILILTNLHNPTGVPIDGREVRALADLAAEEGFYVLIDEIFRDLALDHEPPTMGGLNDRVVVTSGISKFFGAGGLRIGWIRAAEPVLRTVRRVLDYMTVAPPAPSEALALALLGRRDRVAERNRRLMDDGRDLARAWAQENPAMGWIEPAGHIAFPRVGGDTMALVRHLLEKHSTFVAPGESFGLGGHLRINLGRGREVVSGGLARVSRGLKELGG